MAEAISALGAATSAVDIRLAEAHAAIGRLLAENPPPAVVELDDPSGREDEAVETDGSADEGSDENADQSSDGSADESSDEGSADVVDPETEPQEPAVRSDEDAGPLAPAEEARDRVAPTDDASAQQDRQLGSMFRRQGQRGQRDGR